MTIAIYIALGFFFDAWGLGSIVFLLAVALSAGRDEITGGLWITVFAGYLFMGLGFNLWHPGWVIFLVAAAISAFLDEGSNTIEVKKKKNELNNNLSEEEDL